MKKIILFFIVFAVFGCTKHPAATQSTGLSVGVKIPQSFRPELDNGCVTRPTAKRRPPRGLTWFGRREGFAVDARTGGWRREH